METVDSRVEIRTAKTVIKTLTLRHAAWNRDLVALGALHNGEMRCAPACKRQTVSKELTPGKALIFRITHRDNLRWTLEHGLHCQSSKVLDPKFVSIGNGELIQKRARRDIPVLPGGKLSDYIPFYFTPYSPMLLNIKTGYNGIQKRANEEIIILVSSLHKLNAEDVQFLFSDQHAYLAGTQFYSDMDKVSEIDWKILQARDFKRDNDDLGKFDRYMAEALVYKFLPIKALSGVVCYDNATHKSISEQVAVKKLDFKIVKKPGWYF